MLSEGSCITERVFSPRCVIPLNTLTRLKVTYEWRFSRKSYELNNCLTKLDTIYIRKKNIIEGNENIHNKLAKP